MVAVVASYMCLSRVYGFIQKIEVFPAFARASTKRERWCRSASMSASNAWHRREFKIAPSILSADLARLGEEVRGLCIHRVVVLGAAVVVGVDFILGSG